MHIPTPTEIRSEIEKRFAALKITLAKYKTACSELKSIGVDLDVDYACTYSCAIDIVNTYFESLEADLQKEYAENSPVDIRVPALHYKFDKAPKLSHSFRMRLRDIEKLPESEKQQLLSEYLDRIDTDSIARTLAHQVANVSTNELRIHINEIISTLGMDYAHKPIKATARNIAITKSTTNYYHNHGPIEMYKRLALALQSVEEDTGFSFGGGLNEFINCLMHLSHSNQYIESRTSFGSRDTIEIYCYKSKYEFRFSHDAFAAIEAFILVHGCDSSIATMCDFRARANEALAA